MSISISEHSITEFVRWADYLGTFAFAISGTRLAAAHRFDWFGAFVIGLVTAVGGGTIRDVMLDLPVFWMIEPSYILIATLALFVTIVLRHWLVRINNTVFIFDAIRRRCQEFACRTTLVDCPCNGYCNRLFWRDITRHSYQRSPPDLP